MRRTRGGGDRGSQTRVRRFQPVGGAGVGEDRAAHLMHGVGEGERALRVRQGLSRRTRVTRAGR